MADLPTYRYSSFDLPGDQAFEEWRLQMASMFTIGPAGAGLPRGAVSSTLLGDVMSNRCAFNAQRLTRDRRLVEATPDHLVFQYYRSGGFVGDFGGRSVRVSRGRVAVCDLRRGLDVATMRSDTIGLSVPRHLLPEVRADRIDAARERLLAARIVLLHRRLPGTAAADGPRVTEDLLAGLRRIFDPSDAADVLQGGELDADLLSLAERAIMAELGSPDLTPAMIAERMHVSRATLYRVLAPLGGVMRRVWDLRLEAVRAALKEPAHPASLARLATDHGFKTGAHLSRSFRRRYGASPRDWREHQRRLARESPRASPARLRLWWTGLGRSPSPVPPRDRD